MSDCVLATEPSTNPILVTNNLFSINCGALARGVVFKKFDIQVVTEESAEYIQVNIIYNISYKYGHLKEDFNFPSKLN